MNALQYLETAMKLTPLLIAAGKDISAFAAQVYNAVATQGEPTPDDWANMEALEKSLRDDLQAPLPSAT